MLYLSKYSMLNCIHYSMLYCTQYSSLHCIQYSTQQCIQYSTLYCTQATFSQSLVEQCKCYVTSTYHEGARVQEPGHQTACYQSDPLSNTSPVFPACRLLDLKFEVQELNCHCQMCCRSQAVWDLRGNLKIVLFYNSTMSNAVDQCQ